MIFRKIIFKKWVLDSKNIMRICNVYVWCHIYHLLSLVEFFVNENNFTFFKKSFLWANILICMPLLNTCNVLSIYILWFYIFSIALDDAEKHTFLWHRKSLWISFRSRQYYNSIFTLCTCNNMLREHSFIKTFFFELNYQLTQKTILFWIKYIFLFSNVHRLDIFLYHLFLWITLCVTAKTIFFKICIMCIMVVSIFLDCMIHFSKLFYYNLMWYLS